MADPLRVALDQGPRNGVFFLYGDDAYRKEEAARALVDLHVDEGTRDFNLDLLSGSNIDVEALARILATPPMMAPRRVVLIRDAEAFASSPRARDIILELAENPPPDLTCVLVARIPDGSKAKFYRDLKRATHSMEFPAITEADVPGWLMDFAEANHSIGMDEDAARALGGAVGVDLGILAQEMAKLAGLVGERGRITIEDVRNAGTHLPRQDRWEWFDLVGGRRFRAALGGLPVLLQQETGVALTIGLATHVIRLGMVVEGGPQALERALPPHQKWLARRYSAQANAWTIGQIETALLGLRRVDRLLKSSALSDEHHLEAWLLEQMVSGEVAA
ncbi:MAG: DNA polymerase III subunit delta [Gemmatimonadota bacterium]|nr:MAG: DNA polymerase III subunit delta [Gemmatimonadota bacterium]